MSYTESIKWYKQIITEASRKSRSDLGVFVDRISEGNMYFFTYDPKYKTTLPYYDSAPLVIVFSKDVDGFYGLNLHYLPPLLRSQLIKNVDKITQKISWKVLSKAIQNNLVKASVKKYLNSQVNSRVMKINNSEWNKAVLLPLQKFVGSTENKIYQNLGLL